jgi:hypothetical protein
MSRSKSTIGPSNVKSVIGQYIRGEKKIQDLVHPSKLTRIKDYNYLRRSSYKSEETIKRFSQISNSEEDDDDCYPETISNETDPEDSTTGTRQSALKTLNRRSSLSVAKNSYNRRDKKVGIVRRKYVDGERGDGYKRKPRTRETDLSDYVNPLRVTPIKIGNVDRIRFEGDDALITLKPQSASKIVAETCSGGIECCIQLRGSHILKSVCSSESKNEPIKKKRFAISNDAKSLKTELHYYKEKIANELERITALQNEIKEAESELSECEKATKHRLQHDSVCPFSKDEFDGFLKEFLDTSETLTASSSSLVKINLFEGDGLNFVVHDYFTKCYDNANKRITQFADERQMLHKFLQKLNEDRVELQNCISYLNRRSVDVGNLKIRSR